MYSTSLLDQHAFFYNPTGRTILPGFWGSGMALFVYSDPSKTLFLPFCPWICLYYFLHPFITSKPRTPTPSLSLIHTHTHRHTHTQSVLLTAILSSLPRSGTRKGQSDSHLKPWQELQSFEEQTEETTRGESILEA